MEDRAKTVRQVVERLREISGERQLPITEHTEIYADLGIYGDDIAFDLILWLREELGVEGEFKMSRYVPGEGFFRPVTRARIRKLFGLQKEHYESFKVRDVVSAIEAGRWPEDY